MQTWPELQQGIQKRRSGKWAVLLSIGYLIAMIFEFSLTRFVQGTDGRWVVTKSVISEPRMALLTLGFLCISFVLTIIYFVSMCRQRGAASLPSDKSVNGYDLLHVIAWLYAFQTILTLLYGFFIPSPLFPPGSVGGLLESASMHFFIIVLGLIWFRGRLAEIGFQKPKKMIWMWASLILLFIFVVIALDNWVTNPVSEWLQLSPESEREEEIAQEIVQAKATDWTNSIISLLIIAGIVPVAEELLFRGVIQTYLVKRWGALLGITLSSLWFALSHLDLALIAPLFVISMAIGFMRQVFKSLWPAILLHGLNNAASVLFHFV